MPLARVHSATQIRVSGVSRKAGPLSTSTESNYGEVSLRCDVRTSEGVPLFRVDPQPLIPGAETKGVERGSVLAGGRRW